MAPAEPAVAKPTCVALSFNGRTDDSDSSNRGSNPWGATKRPRVWLLASSGIHLPSASLLRNLVARIPFMRTILALALLSLSTSVVLAQAPATPPPPPAPGVGPEVLRSYNGLKVNILKSADKMPEDLYSFKPTPDIRCSRCGS